MFYFLYGKDVHASRKKLHQLLASAEKKRPGAEVFKITSENWDSGRFDELLISRGLFEEKYIVVLDNVLSQKEIKEYVIERLQNMKESEQIFFWLETQVDVVTLRKIETSAAQVQECTAKEETKPEVNLFSITNGILAKDKKRLWVSYVELLQKGASAEELHGILFWQIKNILLTSQTKNEKEAGLSPFVYRNALSGKNKYTIEELRTMSGALVDMTHRVRTGQGDLEIMLEKWILQLA